MQKVFKILVLLLSISLMGCATPEITKLSEQDYKVVGKLHKEEYDEIITIVKQHPGQPLNFYVTSIGGTSEDLLDAMDTVHAHGLVNWYAVDYCDSACAIMALATHHAYGEFKLHSFYSRSHHQVLAAPTYNERILKKLNSYGYDTDRIHHMFDSVEHLWPIIIEDGKIIN
jgi:hypothetical protein